MASRLSVAALVLAASIGLAGCTEGYGYDSVAVGYGGRYYDGYPGYGYGSGYPGSYYGWYGDHYYPGTGIYVYDAYRRPYLWNEGQRRYWTGQRGYGRGPGNWGGFGQSGYRYGGQNGRGYSGYRNNAYSGRAPGGGDATAQSYRAQRDYGQYGGQAQGHWTPPSGAQGAPAGNGQGWHGRGRR